MKTFKLGADPELFLVDALGGFKSSVGLIGGSKMAPRPLEELGDGYAVQEDNVAVEFNVPPASSEREFNKNIELVVSYLETRIKSVYGFHFSKDSAAFFPMEELQDPRALEFGCDPDYNAWTSSINPRPKASDASLRSCGGHVHVGYEFSHDKEKERAIKLMDLFLGVPSVVLDKGALRKSLYGKHGAYRPKPFGVEYRVLSNFWIFDPVLCQWIWKGVDRALSTIENSFDIDALHQPIAEAIDTNNVALAKDLITAYQINMPVYA